MRESYTLRQVTDLSGLSEFTLRGWENRYGAFSPRRTPTGRRQYSSADLQKAMLLRDLLKREYRIGDIAHLGLKVLGQLMNEAGLPGNELAPVASPRVDEILGLAVMQRWDEVEVQLRSFHKKSARDSLHGLILPLLRSLSQAVAAGLVTVSQEHILSALLKEHIYFLRSKAKPARSTYRILVASPEGDFHETGILVAHLMASLSGVHSLFLGANTPKNELAETAVHFGATHVVLGSTVSRKEGAKQDLASFVHFLDKNLPPHTALWIGGRNTLGFEIQLARSHAIFRSLEELEKSIEGLLRNRRSST